MDFTHDFTIDQPIDEVWPVLTNLRAVAQSIPGASIEDEESDGTHSGMLRVKVGAIAAHFRGTARFVHMDPVGRQFTLEGSGQSPHGNATLTVRGRLSGEETTQVELSSTVNLSGALAQFGSSMADQVVRQLLDAFAGNLRTRFEQGPADAAIPVATPQGAGTSSGREASAQALAITPGLPALAGLARPVLIGAGLLLVGVLLGRARSRGCAGGVPHVVYVLSADLPRNDVRGS